MEEKNLVDDTLLNSPTLGMSTMSGTELCARATASRPDLPVIVVTGVGNMETEILAM
jgi:FixJ family two-component response regulator